MKHHLSTVLMYGGRGASRSFIERPLLRELDHSRHELRVVQAEDVRKGDIFKTASLLVIPGGEEKFYDQDLGAAGHENIRAFNRRGGHIMGSCGGAYNCMSEIVFNLGHPNQVVASRSLSLIEGKAIGSITAFGPPYNKSLASAAIVTMEMESGERTGVFYHGGPYFQLKDESGVRTLARFADLPGKPPAIVEREGLSGAGRVVLCGTHPELAAGDLGLYLKHHPHRSDYEHLARELERHETGRNRLWRYLLGNRCELALRAEQPVPRQPWLTIQKPPRSPAGIFPG